MSFVAVGDSAGSQASFGDTQPWTDEMQEEEEVLEEEHQRRRAEWPHYVSNGVVPSLSQPGCLEGQIYREGTTVPDINHPAYEPEASQSDFHVVPSLSHRV